MTDTAKQIPLLFTGWKIRAILDGASQTRRLPTRRNSLVDGRPASKEQWDALDWADAYGPDPGPSPAGNPGPYWHVPVGPAEGEPRVFARVYPRVQVGDLIWCRETWGYRGSKSSWGRDGKSREYYVFYKADGAKGVIPWEPHPAPEPSWLPIQRPRTSDEEVEGSDAELAYSDYLRHFWKLWRPSIFMPKDVCRLWLRVTGVRAQRLQEISEEDARAEGIEPVLRDGLKTRGGLACAWDALHADAPWASNPLVWVYDFEREEAGDV